MSGTDLGKNRVDEPGADVVPLIYQLGMFRKERLIQHLRMSRAKDEIYQVLGIGLSKLDGLEKSPDLFKHLPAACCRFLTLLVEIGPIAERSAVRLVDGRGLELESGGAPLNVWSRCTRLQVGDKLLPNLLLSADRIGGLHSKPSKRGCGRSPLTGLPLIRMIRCWY